MIERFIIDDHDVAVTPFTAGESSCGQFVAQQMAVRRLLRHVAGDGFDVSHREDGSPFIPDFAGEISISHCAGYAALALSHGKRFGIDIERPRATLHRVVHKFLSEAERAVWTGDDDLLRAWTIKESLYKAAGIPGLSLADDLVLPVRERPDIAYIKKDGIAVPYRVESKRIDDCILSIAYQSLSHGIR